MHFKKKILFSQYAVFLPLSLVLFIGITGCEKKNRTAWTGSSAVDCEGDKCAAVGVYNKNFGIAPFLVGSPLVAFSLDGGKTFQSGLFSFSSTSLSETSAVSCHSDSCSAVGVQNFTIIPGNSFSLTGLSVDGGQNYFSVKNDLPFNVSSPSLNNLGGVICKKQKCVGVGSYNVSLSISGGGEPLTKGLAYSVISTDGGRSFSQAVQTKLPENQDPEKNATLTSLSCPTYSNCVAVGYYNYALTSFVAQPYAVFSENGGGRFTKVSKINLPSDANPDAIQYSKLKAVTCKFLECVAVGFYNGETSGKTSALITISRDGGKTFPYSYAPHLAALLPNFNALQGIQLTGIDCVGAYCVMVGSYNTTFLSNPQTPQTGLPLILLSNDSGQTISAAYQPTLPADADPTKYATLTGVKCVDDKCVAVGGYNLVYLNGNLIQGKPMTMFSTNKANSFEVNTFTLPSDSDPTLGAIFGVSSQF